MQATLYRPCTVKMFHKFKVKYFGSCLTKRGFEASYDNPSIIKSKLQYIRRSLEFHSKCKRLMTWSIHPGK